MSELRTSEELVSPFDVLRELREVAQRAGRPVTISADNITSVLLAVEALQRERKAMGEIGGNLLRNEVARVASEQPSLEGKSNLDLIREDIDADKAKGGNFTGMHLDVAYALVECAEALVEINRDHHSRLSAPGWNLVYAALKKVGAL